VRKFCCRAQKIDSWTSPWLGPGPTCLPRDGAPGVGVDDQELETSERWVCRPSTNHELDGRQFGGALGSQGLAALGESGATALLVSRNETACPVLKCESVNCLGCLTFGLLERYTVPSREELYIYMVRRQVATSHPRHHALHNTSCRGLGSFTFHAYACYQHNALSFVPTLSVFLHHRHSLHLHATFS
jgi:hypothetical protein